MSIKMRNWLLVAILLLAALLRFWNLGVYPEAIDEDEMALGYYAYSLLTDGTDEYGNKYPIYFESVGDYKYGVYSYIATIPVGLFGLNPFATRSVAAAAGVASVAVVYSLSMEIFGRRKLAYITATVLAVAPTHIHFSRVAYNNVLGAFFAMTAILLLIKYFKLKAFKKLLLSFLFFLLSIYTYQAYRIYLPLVFIMISLLYVRIPIKKSLSKSLIISSFAVLLTLVSFIPAESRARSQNISLLSDVPKLIEYHAEDGLADTPMIVTRAIHNKIQSLIYGISKRYAGYFDPVFLFFESSANVQRHTTPETGILYLVEAPLLLVGLVSISGLGKKRERFIPFVLLMVGPIAASLVSEPISTTRSVVIIYGFTFFVAAGIYALSEIKKIGWIVGLGILMLYTFNFIYYSHQYLVHKTYHHPWYSDVGLKEMVLEVNRYRNSYQNVVVSGGHYIPFLFFDKIEPSYFIANSVFANQAVANGAKVINFGDIYFNMPYECPLAGKDNVLYVCFGSQLPPSASLVEVIRYRDGQPAILLVEFNGDANKSELPEKVHYSSNIDQRFGDGILPSDYPSFWPLQD